MYENKNLKFNTNSAYLLKRFSSIKRFYISVRKHFNRPCQPYIGIFKNTFFDVQYNAQYKLTKTSYGSIRNDDKTENIFALGRQKIGEENILSMKIESTVLILKLWLHQ